MNYKAAIEGISLDSLVSVLREISCQLAALGNQLTEITGCWCALFWKKEFWEKNEQFSCKAENRPAQCNTSGSWIRQTRAHKRIELVFSLNANPTTTSLILAKIILRSTEFSQSESIYLFVDSAILNAFFPMHLTSTWNTTTK